MINKELANSTLLLGAFTLVGVTLVATTHHITAPIIAINSHNALLRRLNVLVPAQTIDNDIASDTLEVQDPVLLGAAKNLLHRGRKDNQPVAVVVNTTVLDGYAGPIELLVAVQSDGTVGGVRVTTHKETPGLGDKIDERKSSWILGFTGKSLNAPPVDQWLVKRDNGAFDQLTGATITSRAVVKAVRNTLIFTRQQADKLYATVTHQPPSTQVNH